MKKQEELVSIIIINYNGISFLKECLDSVFRIDYPNFEVILVDNGSNDGSLDFVKKYYKKVKFFLNEENNFCKANNIGVINAKGKFVALLNNDTKVDKKWLNELVKVIKNKNCAAVQSKVLLKDGKINSVGLVKLPNFYVENLGFLEKDEGQYDYEKEIYAPYHASTLYNKEKLVSAGLFDEDFEHYVDEIDIAHRLRKKGEKIFFAYKSVVYHLYQGTFSKTQDRFKKYTERNRLYYVAKYYPEKMPDALTSSHFFYKDILNNHPFLISLLPEVVDKLIKHNESKTYIPVIKELIKKVEYILKLDNVDFVKKIDLNEKEKTVLEKERNSLEKEKQVLDVEVENMNRLVELHKKDVEMLTTARDKERELYEKEVENKKEFYEKEIENLETRFEKEREAYEKEIEKLKEHIELHKKDVEMLTTAREKEREIFEKEIEKEKQENIEEVAKLKKRLYEFFNSKGYKYILGPIDKIYKKLL